MSAVRQTSQDWRMAKDFDWPPRHPDDRPNVRAYEEAEFKADRRDVIGFYAFIIISCAIVAVGFWHIGRWVIGLFV